MEVPGWLDLPEDGARLSELRDALEKAIFDIPPDYKVTVILRDIEGLTTEEMADVLGVRTPTVRCAFIAPAWPCEIAWRDSMPAMMEIPQGRHDETSF